MILILVLAQLLSILTVPDEISDIEQVAMVSYFSTREQGDAAASYVASHYPQFESIVPNTLLTDDPGPHARIFVIFHAFSEQRRLLETMKVVESLSWSMDTYHSKRYSSFGKDEWDIIFEKYNNMNQGESVLSDGIAQQVVMMNGRAVVLPPGTSYGEPQMPNPLPISGDQSSEEGG
jgi:hypothetical protein